MKINVFGDVVSTGRLDNLFAKGDWKGILRDFQQEFAEADFNIVNLESPIIHGGSAISKIGPNLKSPEVILDLFKFYNISHVTLANNHILDYGEMGLRNTIKLLTRREIGYVGAGADKHDASKHLKLIKDDVSVSIINVSEAEFSAAGESTFGANNFSLIQIYYQILELKKTGKVILIYHGGNEYHNLPSPRIQDQFRFFVNVGVDVVIGHHTHQFSGYEKYKEGLIFYSLGNFIFDKKGEKESNWNFGYGVSLSIDESNIDFELIPYNQFSKLPKVLRLEKTLDFDIILGNLNSIIQNREELESRFNEFILKKKRSIELVIEPYENRFLKALRRRRIIPSLISKKKLLKMFNYMECPSQRDLVMGYFREKINLNE